MKHIFVVFHNESEDRYIHIEADAQLYMPSESADLFISNLSESARSDLRSDPDAWRIYLLGVSSPITHYAELSEDMTVVTVSVDLEHWQADGRPQPPRPRGEKMCATAEGFEVLPTHPLSSIADDKHTGVWFNA